MFNFKWRERIVEWGLFTTVENKKLWRKYSVWVLLIILLFFSPIGISVLVGTTVPYKVWRDTVLALLLLGMGLQGLLMVAKLFENKGLRWGMHLLRNEAVAVGLLGSVLPLGYWGYYFMTGAYLQADILLAIVQTTSREVDEYVNGVSLWVWLIPVVIFVSLGWLTKRCLYTGGGQRHAYRLLLR